MAENENTTILTAAKAEISRLAASAYSEDGVSLYDHIRVTSRDESTLNAFIVNGEAELLARLKGRQISDFKDAISTTEVGTLKNEYLQNYVCAEWFRRKYVAKYEEYAAKAKAALENLVILVKTRKEPTKGGINL